MTILIYDFHKLEERTSKNLKAWKACHIILYILAAIFGALNYTFLFQAEEVVNRQCIFSPRELDFHWVPKLPKDFDTNNRRTNTNNDSALPVNAVTEANNDNLAQTTVLTTEKAKIVKRDAPEDIKTLKEEVTQEEDDGIMITENITHRFVLNPNRTLFPKETDTRCQFAEYMPLLSAAFAIIWTTMFIMCPSGGKSNANGLVEPWRILSPAVVFAFVMVILTGHSFTSTNGGLLDFCSSFQNYTNATTCSAVNPFIELPTNSSWLLSERIAATRAASAGVWALWACVCALLLARCLTAPDFHVKRTAVRLVRDPDQKVTPYLQKQNSRSPRSTQSSPTKRDAASMRSDPTVTTELVTASVEPIPLVIGWNVELEPGSQSTSLTATPLKDRKLQVEELELAHQNPQERFID